MALEAWNSFYELGSFKLREITLNRPFALAQATRDRLLRWKRIIVGIPPMLKELREHGELNRADLQSPLRLQQQVRDQREAEFHYRRAELVFSSPPVFLRDAELDDFSGHGWSAVLHKPDMCASLPVGKASDRVTGRQIRLGPMG